MRRCAISFSNYYTVLNVEKNVLPTSFEIYIMTPTLIQKRCVMKSYDELKAEMETIQQQMAEAKKSERTNAQKEVKRLCKEFRLKNRLL